MVDTQIFYYRLVFLAELLISEFLFAVRLPKRNHFILRVSLSILSCFVLTFFFPIFSEHPLYLSMMFFVIFAYSLIALYMCFDCSFRSVLFVSLAAYTIQHIAYIVYSVLVETLYLDQIMDFLFSNNPYFNKDSVGGYSLITFIAYISIYFCVYWISYFTLAKRIIKNADMHIKNFAFIFLSIFLVVVVIVLNLISESNENEDIISYYLVNAYALLTCIASLIIQFSQLEEKNIRNELEVYKILFSERKKQYELSKKTIDIINIKCHDLKHQIHKINQNNVIDSDNIKEIEKSLDIYDSSFKTHNNALDVTLTEKSLIALDNNIKLCVIADGSLLSFMKSSDIYSLFGNAIENAIEALKEVDEELKVITLIVKQVNSFVSIHMENKYKGILNVVNGEIFTKKDDHNYHGFGLLSIKSIVEKYKGNISIDTKNNIFKLDIIFNVN